MWCPEKRVEKKLVYESCNSSIFQFSDISLLFSEPHTIFLFMNKSIKNKFCPPQNTDPDVAVIASRILTEVVGPLREVQIDDSEFACLRALVFFDPCK